MMDSSEQPQSSNTVLVLDVDQLVTRIVLFDVVEGIARLINVAESPTTSAAPYYDMLVGIHRAIHRLEDETGRRLLEADRLITPVAPNGDGADTVYITGLPVPPIRVGLVAMDAGQLGNVLSRAVHRSAAHLSDASDYVQMTQASYSPSVLEGWLRDARPTTLVLISQDEPVVEWRASLEIIAGVAPQFGATQGIIVANDQRQNVAAEVLDEVLELSGIDPVSYDMDEIASAVEAELRDQYATRVRSEPAFRALSSATFVDRLQAVENVTAFLHRRMGRNLALVLGQQGTLIRMALEHRGYSVYRSDLDLGMQARSLLQVQSSLVGRWLPFQMTEDEISHWLLNRSLRPLAILDGDNDHAMAAAVTRELLTSVRERAGLNETADIDFIVLGREWFDSIGSSAPLAVLDGLDPLPVEGLVVVSVDRENAAASLGAIAATEPDYAREVVENDFLSPLASCIIFNGTGNVGEPLARVEIVSEEGDRSELSLNLGDIVRVELPDGQNAQVSIYPENSFSIGRSAAGEAVHFGGDGAIIGGELGIIFDGRGRPVDLPIETEARTASLARWAQSLDQSAT